MTNQLEEVMGIRAGGNLGLRVMIVEDEKDIRDILQNIFEDEGYIVKALESGAQLLSEIEEFQPSVLLLDQILPGKHGVDLIKDIRNDAQFRHLPIIMVTGLSGEQDKVVALDFGADDYVTKPFYPKELAARVKALARRTDKNHKEEVPAKLVQGKLSIDYAAHRVFLEDREVALTLTEFKILSELLKQSGQVLTRERLRERALGNLNVTDRTIDVHMASLRKKLEVVGDQIETVRGVGYRFAQSTGS